MYSALFENRKTISDYKGCMAEQKMIYLDYQSTTPVDPLVLDAMLPYFTQHFGNPSSPHSFGVISDEAVEQARSVLLRVLQAQSGKVIFCGSATEAINIFFNHLAKRYAGSGHELITQRTEHKAVLSCCDYLESLGWKIQYVDVDSDGRVDPEAVQGRINTRTKAVALMHVNNETGVVQPIEAIGHLCQEAGVLFMVDAAQSFGKLKIKVEDYGIDFLVISGHKIYAPKGIAACYISDYLLQDISPYTLGGGQELNIRSGTQNVPGIVALAKAASIAAEKLQGEFDRLSALSEFFIEYLYKKVGGIQINGSETDRMPGSMNIFVEGVSNTLLMKSVNEHIAISTTSACINRTRQYSHVLDAMGHTDKRIQCSVRISFGRFTSLEDVQRAVEIFSDAILFIRKNHN
jgi:cysteine desulfurase